MSAYQDTLSGKIGYWLAQHDILSHRERLFLRLAVAIRGGMTAADFLAAQAAGEAEIGRPGHAAVYEALEEKMRDGVHTLAESLAEVTTPDDRCFLMAEEQVSDTSELFQMCYDASKRKKLIIAAVTKPFLFPGYLALMAIGILLLGGTVMLPNFIKVFPLEHWEWASKAVYTIGSVLRNAGIVVVPVLLGFLFWVFWSLPNLFSHFRTEVLDRVFPWSLYKTLNSSNFLVSLAALFKAKVPVLEAVKAYEQSAQPFQAGYAGQMLQRLESEHTSSDMRALDVGFIDLETMMSMKILNVKLLPQEIIQKVGESEMDLLIEEVAAIAVRIARSVVAVIAVVLVFSLYGTFAIFPTLTEKAMSVHGMRK